MATSTISASTSIVTTGFKKVQTSISFLIAADLQARYFKKTGSSTASTALFEIQISTAKNSTVEILEDIASGITSVITAVGFKQAFYLLDMTIATSLYVVKQSDIKNISLTRRPEAITFDGKTAFDMGGIDLGDTSNGLFARPYKVYVEDNTIYIQKGLDASWSAPEVLFTHDGNIDELSLTFDQNARPFVSWEDNGNIYIYWYNPGTAANEKALICSGRYPVSTLDYRHTIYMAESDIMLFYIDGANVKYRQQRDRFTIEYSTDIVLQEEEYLEALWPAPNFRLYLYYTSRLSGKYEIHYWHSSLYPVPVTDNINTGVELVNFSLDDRLWEESVEFKGIEISNIEMVKTYFVPVELPIPDESVEFKGIEISNISMVQTYFVPVELDMEDESVEFKGIEISNVSMPQTYWDPIEITMEDESAEFKGIEISNINMEQTYWD